MVVLYTTRDVVEKIRTDEESIEHSTAAVKPNKGELVGETDRERNMVSERETKEEDTCGQCENRPNG